MCTIAGFCKTKGKCISWEDIERVISNIDVRGRDAFSCVYKEYHEDGFTRIVSESKEVILNSIKVAPLQDIQMMFLVGRAIPASERVSGDISLLRDSQPFFSDNTIISHNGTIANDEKLSELFSIRRKSPVDTSILPDLVDKIGFERAVREINGSFAIAAYTGIGSKCVWLTTNFMPLIMKKEEGVIWWASDEKLLNGGTQIPYYSVMKISVATLNIEESSLPNNLSTNNVVVVCSGGLDSTTTASLYDFLGYDVTLLHFRYGQTAQKAEDYATTLIAEELGVDKYVIDATGILTQISRASPLLGNKEKGERHWDMESTYSYVGARNLIFASMAMSLAEKLGAGIVALGLNLDDSTYPDNNVTFIKELTKLGSLALDWNNRVSIKAPLVNLTKKEIIEVGQAVGTPFHLQVSCYYPTIEDGKIVNCGNCGCDKLREYSFKALKLVDPINYKTPPSWDGCRPYERNMSTERHVPYMEYLLL